MADREGGERFVKSYEEANKLEKSGDAKVVLNIGKDDWPFPIPIVKDAAGWRFDTKAGKEEILNRRIGRNELSTMQAALAYVDAQREYYLRNPQNDKLLQLRAEVRQHPGQARRALFRRRRRANRRARWGRSFDEREGGTATPRARAASRRRTTAITTASSRRRDRTRRAAPTTTSCRAG